MTCHYSLSFDPNSFLSKEYEAQARETIDHRLLNGCMHAVCTHVCIACKYNVHAAYTRTRAHMYATVGMSSFNSNANAGPKKVETQNVIPNADAQRE